MSSNMINLPKTPKELCFNESDFIQDDFDVDMFLQTHKDCAKLETMRDDLGVYLKLLRSAMIDLINRDYSDFVDLSSNLIGLDKAINNLEIPLGQLKEEITQVCRVLNDEINAVSNSLEHGQKIKQRKQSLYSLIHVYKLLEKLSQMLSKEEIREKTVNIDLLEQAAVEYNQVKFHLSRCNKDISNKQNNQIKMVDDLLITQLNEIFFNCLNSNESVSLIRCLRIYVTLDKMKEAEKFVAKQVVGPLIDKTITTENLENDDLGLEGIYQNLLNILNIEIKQLFKLTLPSERVYVKGFNFLVNSFWIEVEDKIQNNLKCIFAPGNPQLFHKSYKKTFEFLTKLEEMCENSELLSTLKNHPQYKSFMKSWNLEVYFQIRFQEIATTIERAYSKPQLSHIKRNATESLSHDGFSLYATNTVWDCINQIWSNDVFLYHLFQKFWKFTLQICSRYQTWSHTELKREILKTGCDNDSNESRLTFLVHLFVDIEKFVRKLPELLNIVQSKLKETLLSSMSPLLSDCVKEVKRNLEDELPLIQNEIVDELLKQSIVYLKQINDIPRLYRRTKREVPTKSCTYVKSALDFLIQFYNEYHSVIPTELNSWLLSAFSSLTDNYLTFVMDLLTSVQKTEESLRRLKKIRDKNSGNSNMEIQGISDDEKIRIQLQVDVHEYTSMANKLGIFDTVIPQLQQLIELVEAASKKQSS